MKMKQIISIILVILWMLIVFSFSGQTGNQSSGISKKVSSIIVDIMDISHSMNQEQKQIKISKIEPIIRKLAHYMIYILGGILIINMLYTINLKYDEKIYYIFSAILGIIFAISDEIHQLFVINRSGKVEDVLIDSIGILTGIASYMIVKKIIDKLICNNDTRGGKQNDC